MRIQMRTRKHAPRMWTTLVEYQSCWRSELSVLSFGLRGRVPFFETYFTLVRFFGFVVDEPGL